MPNQKLLLPVIGAHAVINAVEKFRFEKEPKKVIDQAYEKESLPKELLSRLSGKILLATKNCGIGIWEYIFDQNKFIADDTMLQQFGLTPENFRGTYEELIQFVHPEDKNNVLSEIKKSFTNYIDLDIEYRILRNDGILYIKAIAIVQRDHLGKPSHLIGTNQDITDRTNAETEKEFERTDKEALINSTEDMMWTVSSDFKLIAANRVFIKGMEFMTHSTLKKGDNLLIKELSPEQITFWKDQYNQALSGKSFKIEIFTPAINNWKDSWADISFKPIYKNNDVIGIACSSRNITEEKLAAEKLTESENRFRALIEKSAELITLTSKEGKILYISPSIINAFGYTLEEITPGISFNFIHPDDLENFRKNREKILRSPGSSFNCQLRVLHKNGKWIWCESSLTNMLHEPGVNALVSNFRDISQRISAEKLQEFNRNNLNALINNTNDLMWSIDKNFELITFNQPFFEIIKYISGKELKKGDNIFISILSLEQLERFKISYGRALAGETFTEIEYINARVESWSEISYYPIRKGDEIIGTACHSRDITERKISEKALQTSEQNLQTIFNNASEGFVLTDINGKVKSFNNKALQYIVNNEKGEIAVGCNILDFIDESRRENFKNNSKKLLSGERINYDLYYERKDGKNYWLNFTLTPVYNHSSVEGICITGKDITERKFAELRLTESNERFINASKATFDAIWDWNVKTKMLYLTEGYTELFGYKLENNKTEFTTWSERIHPEDKERVIQDRLNIINDENESNWKDEYRYIKADGSISYVADRGILLRNDTGAYRMIGAMQDVTKLKEEELRLKEVLKEKDSILESIGDAFFAVDNDWTVTYWNSQAEKMLATAKKDIIGNNFWDVFPNSIDSESYIQYNRAIKNHEVIQFEDFYPVVSQWFEISAYPSSTGLSVYFKNITERKLSETNVKELYKSLEKQAKKLTVSNEELERFAYVTSHDLQEPLRMVTNFLQLLQKKYDQQLDETAQKYINFAVDGADRMKTLILDLLEFSRISSTVADHTIINLNNVIIKAKQALRASIDGSQAVINVQYLPSVCGNESQLSQLFQNLISNSIKYKNGLTPVIDISYSETPIEWEFCIADNGIGIDEKFFEKIFIIFQRLHNKKDYPGTGIGLSICKKIVEKHAGKIWVESSQGQGSKFYFTILKLQRPEESSSAKLCPEITHS